MAKQKKNQKKFAPAIFSIILVFIIVVAVNVIVSRFYFRADVTEEKLYTLSSGTSKIAQKLQTPITLKYYFTKNLSSLPLVYKNFGQKVEELLREYKNLNPEMINLEVYNPAPDSDEEEWAEKYGLSGVNLNNGERLFIGLAVVKEDKELNIPLLDPRRERLLEYDITQLIFQLSQKKNKVIGVLSSIPVTGVEVNTMQKFQGQSSSPKWAFIRELEKTFQVKKLDFSLTEIEDNVSILLLIHPKQLSESVLYAIDQFVLRGGELVTLVDPFCRMDKTAAMLSQMGKMAQASSNLDKLFKHWGVDYTPDKILGDKDHASKVNAGRSYGVIPYYLWHTLDKTSFNKELVATKELDDMLMIEPGAFGLKENSKLKLTPLIQSSKKSGMVDSFTARYSDPLSINKNVQFTGKARVMAGILNGEIDSAFKARPKSPEKKDKDKKDGPDSNFKPHLSKSKESVRILVISDVDFIADQFSVNIMNVLGQALIQPKNDNLNFMVNMVEFLGGAEEMMEIRSRGRFSRPFVRFAELEKTAQLKYQKAESELSAKLREVQQKLSKLTVEKGTNKVILNKEQIEKIKQFKAEEKLKRAELRKIRKLLRQDIESEKTFLIAVNLLLVPFLLAIFSFFLYHRRFRRGRK